MTAKTERRPSGTRTGRWRWGHHLVALSAVWLAIAIPVLCPRGPMALFVPWVHADHVAHTVTFGFGDMPPAPAAAPTADPSDMALRKLAVPVPLGATSSAVGLAAVVAHSTVALPSPEVGLPVFADPSGFAPRPALPALDPPPRA